MQRHSSEKCAGGQTGLCNAGGLWLVQIHRTRGVLQRQDLTSHIRDFISINFFSRVTAFVVFLKLLYVDCPSNGWPRSPSTSDGSHQRVTSGCSVSDSLVIQYICTLNVFKRAVSCSRSMESPERSVD